jgi:hypothetical protein
MNAITNPEQEASVLSHVRHDLRMLRTHPWVDFARRRTGLRRQIRDAIARLRTYRQRRQ